MKLTSKLKAWVLKNTDVAGDADEASFKKAVGDCLTSGDLSAKKFAELSQTKEDEEADEAKTLLTSFGESLKSIQELLKNGSSKATAAVGSNGTDDEEDEDEDEDEDDTAVDKGVCKDKPKGKASPTAGVKGTKPSNLETMLGRLAGPFGADVDGEKSLDIRVKEAAESYDGAKSAMVYPETTGTGRKHPNAGRPVMDFSADGAGGRALDNPSERDKAVAGAFGKFQIQAARTGSKSLAFATMPEHDRELLMYALEHEKWGGSSDGGDFADIKGRKLTPREQKAVIDDSTSGGLEAAPIIFDDQVIQTPLLNGELFPLVNTIPIDRGRRVEGVATGTVTGSWGGVDDTQIALFNTASFVSAFDTTIFRWEGAIRVGLDFLSDTPLDFGAHLTSQYGERLLEDLDDVIATGNGTTQPEGVTVKSGTTSVNFGGATSLSNYESLRFGVSKPEHKGSLANTAVFCGSEVSYQRAKAIPVGASDARRLSNTVSMPNYADYSWMGLPYKINESLGNTKVFYAILGRYRMYRRRGLTLRMSTEGDTLIRNNEMLIVATARYGGHLERGAVAAVTSTAPA